MQMNLRKKLLIEDISQFGKILSGREKAEEVVRHIKSRLPLLTEDGFLALNMDRVETIDYPAADEMVKGGFALTWGGEVKKGQHLIWLGGRENVLETIAAAHRNRSVVGFHFKDVEGLRKDQWHLLGELPGHLEYTLRELFRASAANAQELADQMGITLGACQNRLINLMRQGLVVREITNSRGKYIYRFSCRQEKPHPK
jgi:DNA-binding MarR family transcriptional regulator